MLTCFAVVVGVVDDIAAVGRRHRRRRRRRHQMVHIVERLYLSRHEQEACEILATDEIPGYTARGNIWQLLARRVRVRSCCIDQCGEYRRACACAVCLVHCLIMCSWMMMMHCGLVNMAA